MSNNINVEIKGLPIQGKSIRSVTKNDLAGKTTDEINLMFYKDQELSYNFQEVVDIVNQDYLQEKLDAPIYNCLSVVEAQQFMYELVLHLAIQKRIGKQWSKGKSKHVAGQRILTDFIYSIYSNHKLSEYFDYIYKAHKNNNGITCPDDLIYKILKSLSCNDQTKLFFLTENRYMKPESFVNTAGPKIPIISINITLDVEVIYLAQCTAFPLQAMTPFENHSTETDSVEYIKRGGHAQSQRTLDALNQLQSVEWEISKHLDLELVYDEIYNIRLNSKFDLFRMDINKGIVSADKTRGEKGMEAHMYAINYVQQLSHRLSLLQGQNIFFPWELDRCGRMYPSSYQLNPMGAEYEKALLVPAESNFVGRIVTDDNKNRILNGLYLGIAQATGHDKKTLHQQMTKGREYYNNRHNDGAVDHRVPSYPLIKNYLESIDKTNNNVFPNTFVYLDATNQALQIYAVLLKSKQVASLCNLANSTTRADAYQLLADALNERFALLLDGKNAILTRQHVKHSLMTSLYGKLDTTEAIYKALRKDKKDEVKRANKELTMHQSVLQYIGFSDKMCAGEAGLFLPDELNSAIAVIAPEVMMLMNKIIEINKSLILPIYSWSVFNFNASVKVKSHNESEVLYKKGYGSEDDKKLLFRHTIYEADKSSRGLAANVVQSIDGYIAREMILRMNGKFMTTVHDAFGCHPEDLELMMNNYSDIMCELLDSNLLYSILSDLLGNGFGLQLTNDLTANDIKSSIYKLS